MVRYLIDRAAPRTALAAALVALAVVACAPAGGESEAALALARPDDFLLEQVAGGQVRWSDYDGKIRVVNFWATWCPPCATEIPHFNEMAERYRDDGVEILGIALDDSVELVRDFQREIPIDYTSLMYAPELFEWSGELNQVPTTLILDRDGRVFNLHVGFTHEKWFLEDIKALLKRDRERI
jgi:thiol-disulfide isomerase/thioredoxin